MKIRIILLLFVLAVVFANGSSFTGSKPSEMAKIMKQMLIFIQKEKEQIETDKPPLKFPTDISKLSKAKITSGKKLSKDHRQYTSDFFEELGNYYQSNDLEERKTSFNNIVNSCIKCHQRECPGPVGAIQKNLLNATE